MIDVATRDVIELVYEYAADGANSVPLSDQWYDTISGVSGPSGRRRSPCLGGSSAPPFLPLPRRPQ